MLSLFEAHCHRLWGLQLLAPFSRHRRRQDVQMRNTFIILDYFPESLHEAGRGNFSWDHRLEKALSLWYSNLRHCAGKCSFMFDATVAKTIKHAAIFTSTTRMLSVNMTRRFIWTEEAVVTLPSTGSIVKLQHPVILWSQGCANKDNTPKNM